MPEQGKKTASCTPVTVTMRTMLGMDSATTALPAGEREHAPPRRRAVKLVAEHTGHLHEEHTLSDGIRPCDGTVRRRRRRPTLTGITK